MFGECLPLHSFEHRLALAVLLVVGREEALPPAFDAALDDRALLLPSPLGKLLPLEGSGLRGEWLSKGAAVLLPLLPDLGVQFWGGVSAVVGG